MNTPKRETRQTDTSVMDHIRALVDEEQQLLSDEETADHAHLERIQVELDQYWDLLRQRRALRESGGNPDAAGLRDARTVENYEN